MQSSDSSLDKLWLAQVFPSAAPGNLASSGLGSWPSRLPASPVRPAVAQPKAVVKLEPAAAAAAAPAPAVTTGAAAAAVGPPAAAAAPAAGLVKQSSINLEDYDVVDLLGEWSEGSEDAAEKATASDDDIIIIDESDEPEQQEQQYPGSQQQSQQQGSRDWPWLRKQTPQQQQQLQQQQQRHQQANAPADLLQKQQEVKLAVSRLLQSSKGLYQPPEQQRSRQQQGEQQQQPKQRHGRRHQHSAPEEGLPASGAGIHDAAPTSTAAAAAAAGGGLADNSSAHLLRFKPPSKAAAAAAAEGPDKAAGSLKTFKRLNSSAAGSGRHSGSSQGPLQPLPPPQQQQQHHQQQQPSEEDVDEDWEVGLDDLWPEEWKEEWKDVKGAPAPEAYPVYRYNRPPLHPRKPAVAAQGLSKAEQVRMELLGRAPADNSEEEAALAAELVAWAGVSFTRPAAAGGRQWAGQQQRARETSSSRRQEGLTSAGRVAVHRAAAQLVQHQQQAQESEQRLERWQQRQQDEQKQAEIRQQLVAAREERRKQAEAARNAEAAGAADHSGQQAAAGGSRAGIALVHDDALFKQAAAAAAASRPSRAVMRQRHQGPLFLRSSRPPSMGLAAARVAPSRQYPVLKLEDVWAELLSWVSTVAAAAAACNSSCTLRQVQAGHMYMIVSTNLYLRTAQHHMISVCCHPRRGTKGLSAAVLAAAAAVQWRLQPPLHGSFSRRGVCRCASAPWVTTVQCSGGCCWKSYGPAWLPHMRSTCPAALLAGAAAVAAGASSACRSR